MRRLDEPWVKWPATQRVFSALATVGCKGYFVGGCVRDALLSKPVTDIDIATDATPEVARKACEVAGLRVVPTGLDHGTITVISRGKHFELTTFRKDISTDGRRANVIFSKAIEEDAARRDFTMNALYADHVGLVIDPLGGLPDLEARSIRFIGDAHDKITEDYLRILRFFRFYAWYGDPQVGPDPDALSAIAELGDGLAVLSAERVTAELVKLLSAPDPAPAVGLMEQTGILARILPGATARALAPLVHIEQGGQGHSMRRLAALGMAVDVSHLRLSRVQQRGLTAIRDLAANDFNPAEAGYFHGAEVALDGALVRAALSEQMLPRGNFAKIARGASAEFPVKAADLQPGLRGPELGSKLKELEAAWIASDFVLTQEDLLRL